MQRYAYQKQIGQEDLPEEAGMSHLEIVKKQQARQARRRRVMIIGGGIVGAILIVGIAAMGVWLLIKVFAISEVQENTVGESVLRTDRDCYGIHATVPASIQWWNNNCINSGSGGGGEGEFFGKLCFSDELVEWDFTYIDGVLLFVPFKMWLHQQINDVGPEGLSDITSYPFACTVDLLEVYQPHAGLATATVVLDTLSLDGAISGSLVGSKVVTSDVGRKLRANPSRVVVAARDAEDDPPEADNNDIDWWAWVKDERIDEWVAGTALEVS